MPNFFLILLLCLFPSLQQPVRIVMDMAEAAEAFNLLNDIRSNSKNYYKEFRFTKDLKITHTKLIWNDTLAKVAEAKAYDMANRNYFSHTNPEGFGINHLIQKSGYALNPQWIKNKSENYFESLSVGPVDGHELIRALLIDKDNPDLGHRKHLLGIGSWNGSLKDIGIGFARRNTGSDYNTYISIIIAKHNW